MALDLGELVARLRVDDSQYNAGMRAAPETARKAGEQIGEGITRGADGRLRDAKGRFVAAGRNIGQGVGSGVENGFRPSLGRITGLLATIGLGKLAVDAGKFGLEVYSSNEKASISFTTMLGSAEKAQSFLGEMKTFAAQTPFEFPELQTASSRLISAGVESGKVIPIMRTLGDVTSGMGTGSEGITRATTALQQMQAAGKITGEDLNQLRDAGIPVYDLLAAATGKSKEEVSKLAQAGKLGKKELDAMMKALETGKGLEEFNGLMAEQSTSLDGMLSNLKDTLGQGLASAIDDSGLDDDLKGAIVAVTAALPGMIASFESFVQFLRDGAEVVDQNKVLLGGLAVVIGVLAVGYGLLAASQAAAAAGGFVAWIGQVTGLTRAWAVVQAALNVVMSANPIALVVIAIAALVAGLIYAYNTSEEFRSAVDAAFAAVGAAGRWLWNNALAPVIRWIVNGFALVVESIAGMLRALGTVPGFEWATEAADGLDGIARSARDTASGIEDIPDPKVDTGKSQREVDDLNAEIKSLKGKIVEAKAKGNKKELTKLQKDLKEAEKRKYTITATIRAAGTASWALTSKVSGAGGRITAVKAANGGIFVPRLRMFAGGGIRENHVAQIARAGDWRVWAEDETGGESYIPLGASKRSGSIPIWLETGRRLGMLGKEFGVSSLNLRATARGLSNPRPAAVSAAPSSGAAVFHLYDADGVLMGAIRGEIAADRKHNRTVARMGAR